MTDWVEIDPSSPERFWWKVDARRPEQGPMRIVVKRYSDKTLIVVTKGYDERLFENTISRSRSSDYYFPGWQEARQKCLELLDARIAHIQREHQRLTERRRIINSLEKNLQVGEEAGTGPADKGRTVEKE